jgi:hypothetical protein
MSRKVQPDLRKKGERRHASCLLKGADQRCPRDMRSASERVQRPIMRRIIDDRVYRLGANR